MKMFVSNKRLRKKKDTDIENFVKKNNNNSYKKKIEIWNELF